MVIISKTLRCAIVVIITLFITSSWSYVQAVSNDDSSAIVNVWLNGGLTKCETVLSVGYDDDEAFFMLNDDQSYVSQSGQPKLPFQKIQLLLPPNAVMGSIDASFDAEYVEFEGSWSVSPMPPASIVGSNGADLIWPESATIIDGYDADIYGTDAFWPAVEAVRMISGQLRSYKLVELAVPLFRYNPSSGRLQKLVEGDLTVLVSEKKSTKTKTVVTGNAEINSRVSSLALNYAQLSGEYSESYTTKAPNLNDKGYVIITTNAIANGSNKLSEFVTHKSEKYNVSIITENQYGTGSGDTAANNVRAWLQANYTNESYGSGGILYVLLIGDPRVSSSSVPMKLCRGDLPTDYYYAELTGNWDTDGDGIYGEDEDSPEKYFEVYTGRIPYYGNLSDTDRILQKMIDYENATDTAWRRNALLPMVPLDESTQGYQMGEEIKYDVLEPRFITSTRIYSENYGLVPPPEYHLHDRYPATEWSEGKYGMVIWQTHGWSQGGAEVANSGDTGNLDDEHPSAVFQGSCMNGDPDATDNLGYSVIKNGGIGTVAASRNGLYWVGQTNFTNTNSVGGIGYQYAKRIAEGNSLGRAIYGSKEYLIFWQQNYYVYNFYGDPSIVVMPEVPDFGVSPTHGLYFNVVYGGISSDSSSVSIVNNSSASIGWTASKGSAKWYNLSSGSGTVSGNGTANLVVSLNNNIESMPVGTHSDSISIRNTATGQVEKRTVTLVVEPMRKIAHWPMNETSGDTVSDVSGNSRDGSTVNTDFITASATGKFNGGMLFDGVDDYVDVAGFSEDMSGITISVWLRPDDWNGNRRILQKGNDGSEFRLLRENSRMVFELGSSRLEVSEMPAIGSWTHVVVVYDGSEMRMYYNKSIKGTLSRTGTVPTSSRTMYIGSKNDSSISSDLFKGVMDELQIFNYAKDEAGIEALYNGSNLPEVVKPYHGAADVMLMTKMEWLMGMSAVSNDVYIGTDYDTVLEATTSSTEYKGRQSGSIYASATLIKNKEYYWRVDQVDSLGVVTAGPVWWFSTGNGTGGITWEVWYNISGNNLTNLLNNANFPNNPDDTDIMISLEGPQNLAENYGSRMYGFLLPPSTGNYTFWIASDDYSELWLSSNIDPGNVSKIAYVNGATGYQEWEKYSSQKSAEIYLRGGVPYYITVLHKEGAVGDNLSVAFSGPGINRQLVPGEYLMPYADDYNWGPIFSSDRISGKIAYEGDDTFSGSLGREVWSATGSLVTFSKAAGPEWLTVESDGSYQGLACDDNTGTNVFEVTATDANGLSSSAILQIKVADMYTGEKGMEDFSLFAESWLQSVGDYDGSDLAQSNYVDISDMAVFVDKWLMPSANELQESYWPFNTNSSDISGGNDGILKNGASIIHDGIKAGLGAGALSLDGIDDYVEIAGYTGICGQNSRTCMGWVKTSMSQMGIITSWGQNAVGKKWVFYIHTDGSVSVSIWGANIRSFNTVNDGQWHHVAAVLNNDGTPDISEIALYIDGKPVETYITNSMSIDTAAETNMTIGSLDSNAGTGLFAGEIDEVRVYNTALTSEDICHYAGKDLGLYLALDESSGVIAVDYSENGIDGVLQNGPVWQPDSGKYEGSLSYDGVDDYVYVPYIVNPAENQFTAMAWIKGGSANNVIFSQADGDGIGRVWLYIDSAGYLSTVLNAGYSGGLQSSVQWSGYSNEWHNVCLVWDGYRRYLYLDGQIIESDTTDASSVESGNGGLYIGALKTLNDLYFFGGSMDDVAIYNRALTEDEIEAIVVKYSN